MEIRSHSTLCILCYCLSLKKPYRYSVYKNLALSNSAADSIDTGKVTRHADYGARVDVLLNGHHNGLTCFYRDSIVGGLGRDDGLRAAIKRRNDRSDSGFR